MAEQLSIERLSYGPFAIAHAKSGKTVFVRGGVPGDVVVATIEKEGDKSDIASIAELVEASPYRVSPVDGALLENCPWAHVAYEEQLRAKRANVCDALVRIGRMNPYVVEELVAECEAVGTPWHYRNKVELSVGLTGGRPHLGVLGETGGFISVSDDPLLDGAAKGVIKSLQGALGFIMSSRELGLERVGIRCSSYTHDLEVALWTEPGPFPRKHVAKILDDALRGRLTSLVRIMHKGPRAARKIAGTELLSGKGFWTERVGTNAMRVSAPSFFQVNTKGAKRLVELVLEGLNPQEDDCAMDLYCGAGTFTLPLAQTCSFVNAVESYGPCVRDLRRNLGISSLENVDVRGGDAGREFPDEEADIIVVDPPRAGLAREVIEKLSKTSARAIAYVSCDPATLARDLARFEELGVFVPESVRPVDLFPQTFHVETVVSLSRK